MIVADMCFMHTFSKKIVFKRLHFSSKVGWDKSQPSPYIPPGLYYDAAFTQWVGIFYKFTFKSLN